MQKNYIQFNNRSISQNFSFGPYVKQVRQIPIAQPTYQVRQRQGSFKETIPQQKSMNVSQNCRPQMNRSFNQQQIIVQPQYIQPQPKQQFNFVPIVQLSREQSKIYPQSPLAVQKSIVMPINQIQLQDLKQKSPIKFNQQDQFLKEQSNLDQKIRNLDLKLKQTLQKSSQINQQMKQRHLPNNQYIDFSQFNTTKPVVKIEQQNNKFDTVKMKISKHTQEIANKYKYNTQYNDQPDKNKNQQFTFANDKQYSQTQEIKNNNQQQSPTFKVPNENNKNLSLIEKIKLQNQDLAKKYSTNPSINQVQMLQQQLHNNDQQEQLDLQQFQDIQQQCDYDQQIEQFQDEDYNDFDNSIQKDYIQEN